LVPKEDICLYYNTRALVGNGHMYPHWFFQNSSPSSSSPETGSSSKSGDAADGIPDDSNTPLPSESPSNKEENKEKDSSDSIDPLPPKDSSSPIFY